MHLETALPKVFIEAHVNHNSYHLQPRVNFFKAGVVTASFL